MLTMTRIYNETVTGKGVFFSFINNNIMLSHSAEKDRKIHHTV